MPPQEFSIKPEDYASLKDQVAVITGGSSGIGLATTKVLLETGVKIVVGDLNPCPTEHENLSYLKTDVTNWFNLLALFALAKDKYGRVDHTFANAGIGPKAEYFPASPPDTATLQEPNSLTYDINLKSVINTAYIGLHYLRTQQTAGSITLTASASSFQIFGAADYCSAKHGVLGFMRGVLPNLQSISSPSSLAPQIRINCIGPSWTNTGLVSPAICAEAGVLTQEPSVVGQQVALLMADEKRNGEFIYSVGGRHFEVEKSVLGPAGMEAVGGEGEHDGLVRIMGEMAKAGGGGS